MGKKLSEMTLQELWSLFPIILKDPDPVWANWYRQEEKSLKNALKAVRISHIGSTAIKGIKAKPIVDILVEVRKNSMLDDAAARIVECGFRCMSRSKNRISFNKGYTEQGFAEKVFHLHLRYEGDHDELYFRDYLNEHPDAAHAYEKLKLALWKEFEHDRDEYTRRKMNIVEKYTKLAKGEFGDRYEKEK